MQQSNSIKEFENILATEEVKTYYRGGRIYGIHYQNRKYRFETVNIDKNRVLELDQSKEKRRSQENTVKPSKSKEDKDLNPLNYFQEEHESEKQVLSDQKPSLETKEIKPEIQEPNPSENEIHTLSENPTEEIEQENTAISEPQIENLPTESTLDNLSSQEEQNIQELGDLRAQAENQRDQEIDLGR